VFRGVFINTGVTVADNIGDGNAFLFLKKGASMKYFFSPHQIAEMAMQVEGAGIGFYKRQQNLPRMIK
jgi:hypothetical protein